MVGQDGSSRDLALLVVPVVGSLQETGDPWAPYQLLDPDGVVVRPVAEYLSDLQAAGRPGTTQRSYGMDVLRWFRFLWAIECPWGQATRVEARDYCRWIQMVGKPARPERCGDAGDGVEPQSLRSVGKPVPGTPNPVTGKPSPARGYAPATVLHCETVLRGFYQFHLEGGLGRW